jgi:hypothetical protein
MATQKSNTPSTAKPGAAKAPAKPATGKPQQPATKTVIHPLLERENYLIIGAGALLLIIGYLLMVGGEQKPTEWHADEIYSVRRITIAPITCIIGYITIGVGIMKGFQRESDSK